MNALFGRTGFRVRRRLLLLLNLFAVCLCCVGVESDQELLRFFDQYCLSCHADVEPEAGIDLEMTALHWQRRSESLVLEKVYDVLRDHEMPPKKERQPSEEVSQRAAAYLANMLKANEEPGGTVLRRLNRLEYEYTIRQLFDLPEFQTPDSFPADDSLHGFDNLGAGLVLSPPLMASYLELATSVADQLFPPTSDADHHWPIENYAIGSAGLTTAKGSGAKLAGNRFRLASSRNMASAAGWPARFEAPVSGVYRLTLRAEAFQTESMTYERRTAPFRLGVYARPNGEQFYDFFDNLRELAVVEVAPDSTASFTLELELYKGDLFGLRWVDGPAYSAPGVREFSPVFLAERLKRSRRYYAAMLAVKGGPRGATHEEIYELTVETMNRPDLDLDDERLDSLPKAWGGGLSDLPHNWIKSFTLEEMHRFGPALDVFDVSVEGPLRLVEDEEARSRKARVETFLGEKAGGEFDKSKIVQVVERFLSRVFRRPAEKAEIDLYRQLFSEGGALATASDLEAGFHLLIRRALISPQFLYRENRSGELDRYDRASRLSYFLTSAPPDDELSRKVSEGVLATEAAWAVEVRRLLKTEASKRFVSQFTGQWLGTRKLKDIMADPRLVPFFEGDSRAFTREAEMFFQEILDRNLPLQKFIDADFAYRSANLNKIYGGQLKGGVQRVSLAADSHHRGILGLGAVLMSTANGVDTNPIHRGVWLLENVLGKPAPPPPDNVPAIAPDTHGSQSIRAQLRAHRSDPSCAGCHKRIDPLGMVMENFDPVGRWRTHYPVYSEPEEPQKLEEEFYKSIGKGTERGPIIDSLGEMPDGMKLNDVNDLRQYLIEHIDLFARCLTGKLLTYATGRTPSFRDRMEIESIAGEVISRNEGLTDLIVRICSSQAFKTK